MSLISIRKDERRDTWAAFSTLFVLIASHSLLETARDALFLQRVPATRLPWVFLAIAFSSLLVVKLQHGIRQRLEPRLALSALTFLASVITFAFFFSYRQLGPWGVYALYCWSGLLATTLLTFFWALVGGAFTITQAKRLYGVIGAGSALGAIAGSGSATLLSRALSTEGLLGASACGFLVAAAAPWLFRRGATEAVDDPSRAPLRIRDTLSYIFEEKYASRVVLSLLLASACLTVADFVFKSSIAELVPKAELAGLLGSVYFATNALSLLCQLGVVAWLLKRASLGSALSVLPLLLAGTGLGVVAFGGLASVLAVKAADGTLRYSLHRTAAELLFLPLAEGARRRVKAFVDVAGQRGGQVLGSLTILGISAASTSPRLFAVVLVLLAAAWATSAIALRQPYIDLFRTRLKTGRLSHLDEFPELDVTSLESLIAALESEDDREVVAALNILEREDKARFVPALILHHPSEQVVVRALSILTRSGRRNLDKVLARVLDHPSPAVRAASIAAQSVLAPEAANLRERLALETAPEVQAAIVVNLIAAGEFAEDERKARLEALLRRGSPATKIAFCQAIRLRRSSSFFAALLELASSKELDVRRAALTTLNDVFPAESADPEAARVVLVTLIDAIAEQATRELSMQLLTARGAAAFEQLVLRLEDGGTDLHLRWRLPRALGECDPKRAASLLLAWLPRETDGSVRYQVIRELERLVRNDPGLALDRQALQRMLAETASRAFRCLDRRLSLLRGVSKDARRKTPGHELLVSLLRDKESNARGRLFRLLSVLHPNEDFAEIHRGLSAAREQRSTSLELIESIVQEPLRGAVTALVDDGADEERLARAGRFHEPLRLEYEALVAQLSRSKSDAVSEVARFHLLELGLERGAKAGGEAA